MTGSADANLLLAYASPTDPLHARAASHVANSGRLRAPVPAVLETFIVLQRRGACLVEVMAKVADSFAVDNADALFATARTLDRGLVKTFFDAFHVAEALQRGEPLHTADEKLLKSPFPTTPF